MGVPYYVTLKGWQESGESTSTKALSPCSPFLKNRGLSSSQQFVFWCNYRTFEVQLSPQMTKFTPCNEAESMHVASQRLTFTLGQDQRIQCHYVLVLQLATTINLTIQPGSLVDDILLVLLHIAWMCLLLIAWLFLAEYQPQFFTI